MLPVRSYINVHGSCLRNAHRIIIFYPTAVRLNTGNYRLVVNENTFALVSRFPILTICVLQKNPKKQFVQ